MKNDEPLIEGVKLLYDFFKHVTTLSVGSIVVLATFLGKTTSPSLHWRAFAAIAVVGFAVTIVGNLIAACLYAMKAETGDFSYIEGTYATLAGIPFFVGVVAFLLAMICLGIFTIRNLW